MSSNVAADQLRLFIERIERLEEEKKGIADDIKDVYSEAKGQGFDAKTIREIVKLRKMDIHARREREALLDTYKAALGMLDGTPLGNWALKKLSPKPEEPEQAVPAPGSEQGDDEETLYREALRLVAEHQRASTSWLQRQLHIGYNKATALIERMEREGHIGPPDHTGKRDVLVKPSADEHSSTSDAPSEPEITVDDARRMGKEAALNKLPVTANPFPARDERRAAWDEAWCQALGSDGMDIPDALRPTPKPKKNDEPKDGEA